MTATQERTGTELPAEVARSADATREREPRAMPSARWIVGSVLGWLVVVVLCVGVVVYAVGPLLQARSQRALLGQLSTSVDESVGAVSDSLFGATVVTTPPPTGSPVALLEIGGLGLQSAVAEGVDPETTQGGPGHVPGTAGPGQAGNSVVVGRAHGFGGAFGGLGRLTSGQQIVVTTTQGRSLYTVRSVTTGPVDEAAVFGASSDNRLTLVTSSGLSPWNADRATVATAVMVTRPFTPTPQATLPSTLDGRHGDTGQWPLLVLLGVGFALAATGSSVLYRRWSPVATYVICTPVLVTLAVFTAIVAARLLPAWF